MVMPRRLAAIMFTDLVGFTAMTQADEKGALRLLHDQDRLLRPLLEMHRGRKVKSIGDGLLLEFPNALDAIECGVEFQRQVHEHNAREDSRPIRVRIGIHLGDVQREGSDILGDSVNIASRIEPLADPGGVCLTAQVFDQVHNKVPYRLESLGPKTLKGVRQPVGVYRVVLPWEAGESAPGDLSPLRLAILPLANISPDTNDAYFADGLTEEMISALAKVSGLSVISRTSVLQYRDHPKSVSEIGRELGCGTLIEGSVRKVGDRVRVAVQLIDAGQDKHVWSESYDRGLEDIFGIQSEIAQRVTAALKVELLASEKNDIAQRPTDNVDAYQLYLRGLNQYAWITPESLAQAVALFQEAVAIDPRCAVAYAAMAECYHMRSHLQLLQPEEVYPRMKELASKALEINPRSAEGHGALGAVYFHYDWNWTDAEHELLRAIELKPSFGDCYSTLGFLCFVLGRTDEGRKNTKLSAEFSPEPYREISGPGAIMSSGAVILPGDANENVAYLQKVVRKAPTRAVLHYFLGFAYYRASQPDAAVQSLRESVALSHDSSYIRAGLAFILALSGAREEAVAVLNALEEEASTTYVSQIQVASILFALDRRDEAFARLEEAYRRRAIDLVEIRLVPELAPLREDPRWRSIEARMGLPPAGSRPPTDS